MKKIKIALSCLLALFFSTNYYSQIVEVDNSPTPEDLVEMIVGAGVVFSNVTFVGDMNQFGSFEENGSGFDINDGIILATGDAEMAEGPNDGGGSTLGGGNFGVNDVDLDILVNGVGTNDAAILEFDFVPTGDVLNFSYIFASEEYNEYVCSGFNDVFGFFISGPGIVGTFSSPAAFPDGSINIALVPGTSTPVAINTVNNGTAGGSGTASNCEDLDPNWESYNIYYTDNAGGTFLEYDGYTVSLEASATVICGETYHIKLAIADGGDTVLDSGVFLESNSFQAEFTQISASPSIEGSVFYDTDSILVEGCNVGSFIFTRGDTIGSDTINFIVSGDIEDGDLVDNLPDFIVIPSGETTFEVNVQAFADGIDEDLEELTLTYFYIIECTGDTVMTSSTIWLQDQVPPEMVATDESIFCDPLILAPTITQGDGPFFWAWGILPDETTVVSTDPTFTSNVSETTTYWVTVSDPCFNVDSTTVTVTPQDIPPIVLTGNDVSVNCPGEQVDVSVTASGGVGSYGYLWSINNSNTTSISLNPNETQVVSVEVSDECNQSETFEINVTVPIADPELSASVTSAEAPCPGIAANLTVTGSGGFNTDPYTYLWEDGTTENNASFTPNDFGVTSYSVIVTDNCGVSTEVSGNITIFEADPPLAAVVSSGESPCPGTSVTLQVTASGGHNLNPYTYLWENGTTNNSSSFAPTDIGITPFTVIVTDNCGITTEVSGNINVSFPNPIVLTTAEEMCIGLTSVLATEGGLQPISITTSVGVHVDDNNIVTGSLPGIATITAFDGCGQTADVDILVLACEITIPNIFTPNSSLGENDFFVVDGLENFPNSKLTIFNRWGNIVYESSNYLNNWAATDVAGGVYYYILNLSDGKNFSSYVEVLK